MYLLVSGLIKALCPEIDSTTSLAFIMSVYIITVTLISMSSIFFRVIMTDKMWLKCYFTVVFTRQLGNIDCLPKVCLLCIELYWCSEKEFEVFLKSNLRNNEFPIFQQRKESELKKADNILGFAEWLYCNQFPLSDSIKHLDWAISILLNLIPIRKNYDEDGMCLNTFLYNFE